MLRVQIESLVAGIDGQETIMTTETATIGNLIAGFVFERRLRPEIVADLSLQDISGNILKHHKTVASYELKDGDKVYLAKNDAQVLLGCRNWFAIALIALAISLVGFGVLGYMYSRLGEYPFDYVVVVDAGSTHTDLVVYQWHANKFKGTGFVEEVVSTRCEGYGLENYNDSRKAAQSIASCLNFATEHVPLAALGSTEIYLGGTAGMRILRMENETAAKTIMDSIRTEIHGNYGFNYSPDNVRIISGEEEGAYGWMTTNFLAKTLPSERHPFSYGALDLGGASAQLSFVPFNSTSTFSVTKLNLFSEEYELYTHSYLCYGLREAERRLKALLIVQQQQSNQSVSVIQNPCQPVGNTSIERLSDIFGHFCTQNFTLPNITESSYTFNGTSDSLLCGLEIKKLFEKVSCLSPTCSVGRTEASVDQFRTPTLNGTFMAFSGFYSIMEFLNLTDGASSVPLTVFRNATEAFCSKNWTEISRLNASDPHSPYLTMYCFDAHFVDALLTTGYGFTNETFEDIKFMKDIAGTSVGWSLGLALNSTNAREVEPPIPSVTTAVFALLMVLFTVLLIFSFIFLARAYRVARRFRNYEPLSTYGAI